LGGTQHAFVFALGIGHTLGSGGFGGSEHRAHEHAGLVHKARQALAVGVHVFNGPRGHARGLRSARHGGRNAQDQARIKRGGDLVRVVFDDDLKLTTSKDGDILALEEFLQELAQLDERQAKIVEMRFFGGMTVPEVAEVLGLSTRTIENEWRMCRAWLRKRIEESQ